MHHVTKYVLLNHTSIHKYIPVLISTVDLKSKQTVIGTVYKGSELNLGYFVEKDGQLSKALQVTFNLIFTCTSGHLEFMEYTDTQVITHIYHKGMYS